MVAVLVLLYCLYVVQDWLDMLTHDQVPFVIIDMPLSSFAHVPCQNTEGFEVELHSLSLIQHKFWPGTSQLSL